MANENRACSKTAGRRLIDVTTSLMPIYPPRACGCGFRRLNIYQRNIKMIGKQTKKDKSGLFCMQMPKLGCCLDSELLVLSLNSFYSGIE